MKLATDPRALELLMERAMRPLDDKEHWELRELGVEEDDSFDLAAAGLAIAMTPIEPMPAELANKLLNASPAFDVMKTIAGGSMTDLAGGSVAGMFPGSIRTLPGVRAELPRTTAPRGAEPRAPEPQAPDPAQWQQQPYARPLSDAPIPVVTAPPPPRTDIERARDKKRSRFAVVAPWIAAAACLALAIGTFLWARDQKPGTSTVATAPPAPSVAREQLLATANDVTKLEWTATADPNAKGAAGDVIWSQREQKGYMRFVGLTPNDAKQFQYQLWIFDKNRDDKYPVDGGVFDVSSTGEVIVPITARVTVDDATLFAVTIERPGGVVVSKRERIVVTAARKG